MESVVNLLIPYLVNFGVTGTAVFCAVWAASRFLSTKWVDTYFEKSKESHKQALGSVYNKELKAFEFAISGLLQESQSGHQIDQAAFQDKLNKGTEILKAQLASIAEGLKSGLDLEFKTRVAVSERRLEPYKAGKSWSR